MPSTQEKHTGFSIVELLLIIVTIGVIGLIGWSVYRYHSANRFEMSASTPSAGQQTAATKPLPSTASAPASGSTQSTSQPATPKPQAIPDIGPHTGVYATWKTYCDFAYHYCFKYPKNWGVLSDSAAPVLGGLGEVLLLNPAKTIQVIYINDYTKDQAVMKFMPASIDRLTSANQALTIVGGYIPTSGDNGLAGNNVPAYEVVDSSLLDRYPLTVGKESQFPNTARFTDQHTGGFVYEGEFTVMPAATINSLAETRAWFSNADVKTGLLILKSLSYQAKL